MLSQFLVDFGRRHGFVSERQFEAAAAAADQQLTELDLIFEVSQRYFALLQAQTIDRGLRESSGAAPVSPARGTG